MSGNNGNGKKRDWGEIDVQLVDPHGALHEGITMPGHEGIPFRGSVPNLKADDPEHLQPQAGQKAHVEILDLWKPTELARYRTICQVVANGFGAISKEDMQFDSKKKNWRVFIRWLEFYTAVTKGGINGRGR